MARDLFNCQQIVVAADSGKVVLISHAFGYNQELPQELMGGDLVFNIYGPPRDTAIEQTLCLSDTGQLVTMANQRLSEEFDRNPVVDTDGVQSEFFVYQKKH
jgi:hypothetical protein